MADYQQAVESSVKIYKMLIKAYPASFRREYENEMTQVFQELATNALQRRGVLGLVMIWFRVLGDLFRTAPQEHLFELQRRIAMKTALWAVFCSVLAVITEIVFVGGAIVSWLMIYVIIGNIRGVTLAYFVGLSTFYLQPIIVSGIIMFVTGMILTRVKPFYKPFVTAPLGAMIGWGIICVGKFSLWITILFLVSAGLVTLLGCFVASKMSNRAQKNLPQEEIPVISA